MGARDGWSPDFFPHVVAAAAVESMGSGAMVTVFADELRRLSNNPSTWQAEMGAPGAYGMVVQRAVQQIIEKHPVAGVAPHVHLCIVRRGNVGMSTSDHTRFEASGTRTEWRMPPVATTWPEFEAMTRQAFGGAADASTATT